MEEGLAHIFLVSQNKTVMKAKIEKSIGKNNGAFSKSAANKAKFFDMVIDQVKNHFTGDNSNAYLRVQCCIVGSPGFVAGNFYEHLK